MHAPDGPVELPKTALNKSAQSPQFTAQMIVKNSPPSLPRTVRPQERLVARLQRRILPACPDTVVDVRDSDEDEGDDCESDAGAQTFIQKCHNRGTYRIVDTAGQQLKNNELVTWLRSNFEEKTGCILRHDYLYRMYLLHAGRCGLKHDELLHESSVRCIVRATFRGLSNRCFGRKGGSKNDYFGLQVISPSTLRDRNEGDGQPSTTNSSAEEHGSPEDSSSMVTVIPTSVPEELYSHLSIGTKIWTADNIKTFNRALTKFGKRFPKISREIPGKSIKDCIEFYYAWKKCFPEDYSILKTSRRWKEIKASTYRVMRQLKM